MSNLKKGLVLVIVVLAIGGGLVFWKNKVGGHGSHSFNSISKEEIEMLLADVAKTNPMALKRLAEDPKMKTEQLENLKQLLAFASQAQAEGLADEPDNKRELENIRAEIVSVNYDREINKDKGPMPPFGFIAEDRIKAFWGDGEQPVETGWLEKIGLGKAAEVQSREAEFEKFIETKVKLMKAGNPQMADREITEEEKKQAKEFFAKVRIYEDEYDEKVSAGALSKEFQDKVNLQLKLQQAQFLARLYSEKAAEKAKVTDEEIATYIAEHPELDPKDKKAKADEILNRAKGGEDFAALANEFSQDPGNKGTKGESQGGLYKDVPKGRMVPAFETAALALEPGQVAPELVETDFGFHIIKLEKKGEAKNANGEPSEVYDVRHVLITTGYKDPNDPAAREVPVKEYVRQKLQEEKEKKVIEEIVAQNNVQVPEDFTVPEVTEEQMQEMMKKQMPMPQGDAEGAEAPAPPPPAAPADEEKK
ncbi:MAG: peptidylprolyl isomerase [Pyrinomonadaceae bacterium]